MRKPDWQQLLTPAYRETDEKMGGLDTVLYLALIAGFTFAFVAVALILVAMYGN